MVFYVHPPADLTLLDPPFSCHTNATLSGLLWQPTLRSGSLHTSFPLSVSFPPHSYFSCLHRTHFTSQLARRVLSCFSEAILARISSAFSEHLAANMGAYSQVWTLLLVLSVAAKAHAQTCSATDQSALLYASREIVLSGKAFMTWLDGTNCCTWEGVTCNSAGRVEALTVVSADVPAAPPSGPTYTICSGLGDLNSLKNLTIINVALNGELPTTFGGLVNLEVLNMDGCNLVKAIPQEICSLGKLNTLIMKNNLLDSYPDCINSMSALTTIDLTGNAFSGAPKKP